MKKLLFVFPVLFLLACNAENKEMASTGAAPAVGAEPEAAADQASEPKAAEEAVPMPQQRMIVRDGEISFQTGDLAKTRHIILNSCRELGGYVAEESQAKYSGRTENTILVRIPSQKFDVLLERISAEARFLDVKNIRASDVTEEFVDTRARLQTKKELEQRYLELLRKAGKLEDVLKIEEHLAAVRADIEVTEGRLNYLSHAVSMSSLRITYYEQSATTDGFASKLWDAVASGWRGLSLFVIFLARLWPFLLIAGTILWIIFRKDVHLRKRQK